MKDYDSIRIIGFGKAAAEMVSTVRNIVHLKNKRHLWAFGDEA